MPESIFGATAEMTETTHTGATKVDTAIDEAQIMDERNGTAEKTHNEATDTDTTNADLSVIGGTGLQKRLDSTSTEGSKPERDSAKRKESEDVTAAPVAAKRARKTLFDRVIQILVGPSEEVFEIHRGILCELSSYFKAAVEGDFKEAQEGKIVLAEEEPEIFELFQLWAYTGSFTTKGQTIKDMESRSFIDLYIFAEARDIPRLQNATIDALIDWRKALGLVPINYVPKVYENTCEHSPLRKLLVDFAAGVDGIVLAPWFEKNAKVGWPSEYFISLVSELYGQSAGEQKAKGEYFVSREKYYVPVPELASKGNST